MSEQGRPYYGYIYPCSCDTSGWSCGYNETAWCACGVVAYIIRGSEHSVLNLADENVPLGEGCAAYLRFAAPVAIPAALPVGARTIVLAKLLDYTMRQETNGSVVDQIDTDDVLYARTPNGPVIHNGYTGSVDDLWAFNVVDVPQDERASLDAEIYAVVGDYRAVEEGRLRLHRVGGKIHVVAGETRPAIYYDPVRDAYILVCPTQTGHLTIIGPDGTVYYDGDCEQSMNVSDYMSHASLQILLKDGNGDTYFGTKYAMETDFFAGDTGCIDYSYSGDPVYCDDGEPDDYIDVCSRQPPQAFK